MSSLLPLLARQAATRLEDDNYDYEPSLALAVLSTVIFAALTGLHGYQLLRTRAWSFAIFWLGGFLEVIGYIFRIIGANDYPYSNRTEYIASQVAILVAPSLLAASMYMLLGRIIRVCDAEEFSIIPVKWLTKFFVVGDVIAFVTQAGGGGMLASDDKDTADTGRIILIVGLAIQVLFFGLFVVASCLFHHRITRNPTPKILHNRLPWKKHLINVYAASCLVLARCIFRLVEYIEGKDGYLLTHEWPMYVFDTLLMAIVMALFNLIHPSEVNALLLGSGTVIHQIVFTRVLALSDVRVGDKLADPSVPLEPMRVERGIPM